MALLLKLRFRLVSAVVLAGLFSVHPVVTLVYRDNAAQAIESLTMMGWLYLVLAAVIFVFGIPNAWRAVGQLRAEMVKGVRAAGPG